MSELQTRAKTLLESQAVNVVIGYGEGTSGKVRAIFPRKAEEAEKLVFDERCEQNLAIYLLKHEIKHMGKMAVVATIPILCSILQVASEYQITEDMLVALFVNPDGSITEMKSFKEMEDFLKNQDTGFGDKDRALIEKLDGMTMEERWDFWADELSRCFKCYACRASCPMCYCTRCFVEVNQPQYIPIAANDLGSIEWHLLRAMHLAGRCINCGECGRACPLEIPIHLLTFKGVEDARADFGVTAGMKANMESMLSSYKTDDKESFIR